jgi:hypothetical protein
MSMTGVNIVNPEKNPMTFRLSRIEPTLIQGGAAGEIGSVTNLEKAIGVPSKKRAALHAGLISTGGKNG